MQAAYNFASAFSIDPRNGQIVVNEPLSYNSAAVILLTVRVTDKNAEGDREQSDTGARAQCHDFRNMFAKNGFCYALKSGNRELQQELCTR
jgi:hypothetical protein